jgi:hypothetical protein
VHVTGIASTPNNAPIAVRDTASVLQPNSKVINVGNNDSDPDGNAFCVTTVYGSANFSVAVTGNCTSVKYAPDSLFIGKDSCWYVICDNGTPSLCDTAVLVVQSLYNAALLPVASFTSSPDIFNNCNQILPQLLHSFMSTTANADSVIWKITLRNPILGNSCNDSVANLYGDSVATNLVGPPNFKSCEFEQIEVCMTAINKYGSNTICKVNCGDVVWMGISEILLSGINLYPNPSNSNIIIDMSKNDEDITHNFTAIEIYNVLGEKVKLQEHRDQSKVITIALADLPNGMYLASILDSKGAKRMLGRFVKE